jgi:hypothetical protein
MLLDQLILLLPEQPSNPWCILSKEEHEALRAETELGQVRCSACRPLCLDGSL